MDEAKTTWALVVGIDEYDDSRLRRLTGAVADAVAAVKWLRRLGVPDAQIFLHAAPSGINRPPLDALNLPCRKADEPTIWSSVAALREVVGGTRLFVLLSGHGLYDPETRRLFLTQEAGPKQGYTNLGMDEYTELFRSMAFKRQFLFLDGCQNYPYSEKARPTVRASMHPGIGGYNARAENVLFSCYAASQDERAVEIEGRGALLGCLLEKLDPDAPWSLAVDLDFETGSRAIDLRKLLEEYVAPWISDAAARQKPPVKQNPVLEVQGTETLASRRIIRLPECPTAALRLVVDPEAAQKDVGMVKLAVEEDSKGQPLGWLRRLPSPTADQIRFPVHNQLPVGVKATVQYKVRPESASDSEVESPNAVFVDGDQVLLLPVKSKAAPPPDSRWNDFLKEGIVVAKEIATPAVLADDGEVFRIRTHDVEGRLTDNAFNYSELARDLGIASVPRTGEEVVAGVRIVRHEYGPDLVAQPGYLEVGRSVAMSWAETLQRLTAGSIGVSLELPRSRRETAPNLRFVFPQGGAEAIAGFIATSELVWVGPPGDDFELDNEGRWISLDELSREQAIHVEPGPIKVRITLPWGVWTRTVQVPASGEARIELPASIGIPPLRIALQEQINRIEAWPEEDRADTTVFGIEGEAPEGFVRRGLASEDRVPFQPEPGRKLWSLRLDVHAAGEMEAPMGCSLASLVLDEETRISFPLLEARALAVDRTGGGVRVEPLSGILLPSWDKLVASGRLEPLSAEETEDLIASQKAEWLLGVAAAYSAYAFPLDFRRPFFDRVLESLKRLAEKRRKRGRSIPDIDLLRIALAARSHHLKGWQPLLEPNRGWFLVQEATECLEDWAKARSVPVFRWGVPLAVHLLAWAGTKEPFASWREELARIVPLLDPLSVWTAWAEGRKVKVAD